MSVKTVNVQATSVEEAFSQAGLTWIAEQAEMINSANGKTIDNHKVIYRNDNNNQLGVVGKNYGIIQPLMCFSFFNEICIKNNANICKVYEYNNGSTIHLEAEVKDKKFDSKVGDEIGFKFDLFNSFDGKHKAHVRYGALRLVCLNGLVSMSKDMAMVEIRHTQNAVSRLDQAIKIWAAGENWYNSFITNVKILTQKMVDKQMVDMFLESLLGDSDSTVNTKKKENIIELFEHGKGNKGETAFDLVNGVTEFIDHHSKKDEQDRIEYANLGAGYNLKAKAFELAMKI